MSSGVLVLIATGLAGLFGIARMWRGAEARAVQLATEREALIAEREELTARLSREAQTRKKQAEELAERRKRADKAKKRKARGAQDLPLGTASRISDLEAQIERAERERDRSRDEREQLARQVAQLEARIEISTRAAEQGAAAQARGPAPTGPTESTEPTEPTEPVEGGAEPGAEALGAELAEARERATKLAEELRGAKETEARMRKRMNNQEQLYASLRAELDVKKDRIRTQDEQIRRLEAIEVVVGD